MQQRTFEAAKETLSWVIEHKVLLSDSTLDTALRNHGLPPEDRDEFFDALLGFARALEDLEMGDLQEHLLEPEP